MKKKILLLLCGVLLLLAAGAGGAGFYYYTHPESLKPVIEGSISEAAGAPCRIKEISYSLTPLRIEMKGLRLGGGEDEKTPLLRSGRISARLALVGSFGQKVLVFEEIGLEDFRISITERSRLPRLEKDVTGDSSWWSKVQGELIKVFLFREIAVETVRAGTGSVNLSLFDKRLTLDGITAVLDSRRGSEITCAARLSWPEKEAELVVPQIRIVTETPFFPLKGDVQGRIRVGKAGFRSPDLDIRDIQIEGNLAYSHEDGILDLQETAVFFEGIEPKEMEIKSMDLVVKARGRMDLAEKDLYLSALHLEVPQLLELDGKFEAHLTEEPHAFLQILNTQFKANEISHLLKGQSPALRSFPSLSGNIVVKGVAEYSGATRSLDYDVGVTLPGNRISFSGQDLEAEGRIRGSIKADGKYPGDENGSYVLGKWGSMSLSGTLGVSELSFEALKGDFIGENLSITAEIEGDFSEGKALSEVPVSLEIEKGEVLYDRYYFNLKEKSFSSSLGFRVNLTRDSLFLSRMDASLEDIIALRTQGVVGKRQGRRRVELTVKLPPTPLSPVFEHFLRAPFQAERPFLKTLETGGRISASLKIRAIGPAPKELEVRGRCLWEEGRLASGERDLSWKGISMDLPLWYRTGGGKGIKAPLKGALSIESLDLPPLPDQPLDIGITAGRNSFFVNFKDALLVPGGTVSLGPVAFKAPFSEELSFQTSAGINIADLRPLVSGLIPLRDKGSLKGKLDSIRYSKGKLETRGAVKARLFGGRISLYDIGARSLFTSGPVFRASAELHHLNLEKMTSGTSFGRIQGILEGYVRHLEVAYGQPQSFHLFLETVKEEGIPQRISVEAVDNIARIGSGSSPFLGLAGGIAKLFSEFPYEKIGVRSRLKNDVFQIKGTVKEDGTEYLVKRGGFSGVNIVNRNPDNRISFKDMMKRIQRVTASDGEGPVIK